MQNAALGERYAKLFIFAVLVAALLACGREVEPPTQKFSPRPIPTERPALEAFYIPCDDERLEATWDLLSRIYGRGDDYYIDLISYEHEYSWEHAEWLFFRCSDYLEDLMHENVPVIP